MIFSRSKNSLYGFFAVMIFSRYEKLAVDFFAVWFFRGRKIRYMVFSRSWFSRGMKNSRSIFSRYDFFAVEKIAIWFFRGVKFAVLYLHTNIHMHFDTILTAYLLNDRVRILLLQIFINFGKENQLLFSFFAGGNLPTPPWAFLFSFFAGG